LDAALAATRRRPRRLVDRTAMVRWREFGRRYRCDVIDFFPFRDAMVTEFSQYPDGGWIEAQTEN
jgi:ketosteroid isomerase-like protein